MKETENSPICAQASNLIAFLYGEATDAEAHNVEQHLEECQACAQELASFGFVREAIATWREEALSVFTTATPAVHTHRKSALAAIRQFFELSPLWLKSATAFAAVVFCVLAALAMVQVSKEDRPPSIPAIRNATYTRQDVDRIVNEALAKHELRTPAVEIQKVAQPPERRNAEMIRRGTAPKSRRPLSRAEREQLAADLRLLSTGNDLNLNLLGDLINE
jgi:anti-sigma factor RsiW